MERFSKESVGRFGFWRFERTCLELLATDVCERALVLAGADCIRGFLCDKWDSMLLLTFVELSVVEWEFDLFSSNKCEHGFSLSGLFLCFRF
jgi:hypothetical protein